MGFYKEQVNQNAGPVCVAVPITQTARAREGDKNVETHPGGRNTNYNNNIATK